jgi:hypothetical protein
VDVDWWTDGTTNRMEATVMKRILCVLLALNLGAFVWKTAGAGTGPGETFLADPGDINGDGKLDIADPVALLEHLFLGGPAPAATAQTNELSGRLAALEALLQGVRREDDTLVVEGNLQVVNGMGSTGSENGAGNLIVGYNEERTGNENVPGLAPNERTGSHNLILGRRQNYTSHGAIVAGSVNASNAPFASVLGGIAEVADDEREVVGGLPERGREVLSYMGVGMTDRFEFDPEPVPTIFIRGANLQITSAADWSDPQCQAAGDEFCIDGTGNLIVGPNLLRDDTGEPEDENLRTGSNNMVVGDGLNYTSHGSIIAGSYRNSTHAWSQALSSSSSAHLKCTCPGATP